LEFKFDFAFFEQFSVFFSLSFSGQIFCSHFADEGLVFIFALIVAKLIVVSYQINARFLSGAKLIRVSNVPEVAEGVVHFSPVRPRKVSRLLSDVGRVQPVKP